MQKYLKSCEIRITQQEAQAIFKLRTGTSEVKANYKGKFETLECDGCKIENEFQKHVIQEGKILNKNKKKEIPEYEEILTENVKLKMQSAKKFLENRKGRGEKFQRKKVRIAKKV